MAQNRLHRTARPSRRLQLWSVFATVIDVRSEGFVKARLRAWRNYYVSGFRTEWVLFLFWNTHERVARQSVPFSCSPLCNG
ncbi:hypothetical protein ARMGADRAFT_1014169 [Armillaria gallica]|uniref:Uncharacterized protein n=1 Tax=Armillaria gallica TaxID=47427 RepID=A0A2H3DUZ4_ARMGA|nr:hypothetical protein ARMGADRAFT_1014169 [Armillaria gallica]